MKIDKLINVSTYAKEIGKTTSWVYKLIREGKIKHTKIDKTTFIVK